ncbi:hypothetical protein FE634_02305 [Nocardioides dongxiaopingii]|uniref:hypothetical protein n=1 Tax=Nocardioides sp. S-1144 TaxID=2582905 RepID=UPI00110DCEED|nr:hypothetical protein [Nocardioides sp. S-1144]QCW49536.1 hypothetical protein FE634_02305 [Nocardioides sp. S-1144]
MDAARNVVRGAEQAVDRDNDLVLRFNERHPTLKTLRDRFEHYEDYVRGTGDAQRTGRRRNGELLTLDGAGIEVAASEGGGAEGHLVRIAVVERDADDQPTESVYQAPTRQIAIAVRQLARDLIAEVDYLTNVISVHARSAPILKASEVLERVSPPKSIIEAATLPMSA